MNNNKVKIIWPKNITRVCRPGENWLRAAAAAKIDIPTGCLVGSCGACEIEVNGEVIRACIANVPNKNKLKVEFFNDPYW